MLLWCAVHVYVVLNELKRLKAKFSVFTTFMYNMRAKENADDIDTFYAH